MNEKKAAKKIVDIKELTERLGPARKVVKTSKAEGTDSAVVLHLECGHKRVGTKRATLRCRKCRKGVKSPAIAKIEKKKPAVKKPVAVKKSVEKKKAAVKREPVVIDPIEMLREAMDRKATLRRKK